MRFALVILPLAILLAIPGCDSGDDEPTRPDVTSDDPQQIADLVNDLLGALKAGDAKEACSYMTARGQRAMGKLIQRAEGSTGDEPLTCAEAVVLFADAVSGSEGEPLNGGRFDAGDISFTDRDAGTAQAECRFRGAVLLTRTEGEWLVDVPACID